MCMYQYYTFTVYFSAIKKKNDMIMNEYDKI